jgi:hypothetical protein
MSATINGKELLSLLPHRYGYATKIVERLRQKGIFVTQATVYHTVAGKCHNPDIIGELVELIGEYKTQKHHLEERIKALE